MNKSVHRIIIEHMVTTLRIFLDYIKDLPDYEGVAGHIREAHKQLAKESPGPENDRSV